MHSDNETHFTGSVEAKELNAQAAKFLQRIRQSNRGHLKLFFGAAPGVGKTFAMLEQAREKRNEGLDVLVGWVDTHGRKDTQALLSGLDVLARKRILFNDFSYEEFDIDEVLRRKPALVIVDELAHTNAPGSRHAKRWQDVEELLASGIDVYTALNVQHLESLIDVVEKMTGVQVNETVPDRLFEEAYEVRFVDLPPNDLIARLRAGKIYLQETIEAALNGFFKKSNLHALRELALRKMAQRVGQFERVHAPVNESPLYQSEILLYLNRASTAETLVRECSRLAYSMQVPWTALWIDGGSTDDNDRDRINAALRLAEELDGAVHVAESMSVEATLTSYADAKGIRLIVAGDDAIGGRLKRKLMRRLPSLELMLVSAAHKEKKSVKELLSKLAGEFLGDGWWQSFAVISLLTLLLLFIQETISLDVIAILYLFPIIFIALRFGRWPAVFGAFFSALLFDIAFIEPKLSLSVAEGKYLLLLAAMVCVGLGIGTVISRLRKISELSAKRALQTQVLFSLSKELGRALQLEDIAKSVSEQFKELHSGVSIKLWECLDDSAVLKPVSGPQAEIDEAVAQWVVKHGEPAGCGTHTLSQVPFLYYPLKGSIRVRGVMCLMSEDKSIYKDIEFQRLANSIAVSVAQAFERLHYIAVSQQTLVEMEAQKFRHALISEISHDLRTPLAVLRNNAEDLEHSLVLTRHPESEKAAELLESIGQMTHLTDNMLEMARLQSNTIQIKREWCPVEDVLGSALATFPSSILKKFRISVRVEDNVPPLFADMVLVNRVLVNFLDNATKFCEPGTEIILEASAKDRQIELSVTDKGPGLPSNPSGLFDPFNRGTKESGKPGIGLGLSICKMIARVHHGRIIACNNTDCGAKFSFLIPMKDLPQLDDDPVV